MLQQQGQSGLRQLKSSERVLTPVSREALLAHVPERCRLIATRVMDGNRKWCETFRLGYEASRIRSLRCIADDKRGGGTGALQLGGGGFELFRVAAGHHH